MPIIERHEMMNTTDINEDMFIVGNRFLDLDLYRKNYVVDLAKIIYIASVS